MFCEECRSPDPIGMLPSHSRGLLRRKLRSIWETVHVLFESAGSLGTRRKGEQSWALTA